MKKSPEYLVMNPVYNNWLINPYPTQYEHAIVKSYMGEIDTIRVKVPLRLYTKIDDIYAIKKYNLEHVIREVSNDK